MSESQHHKGFARSEIQKVHEQKMEKFQQSQQPRQCPPVRFQEKYILQIIAPTYL
jgi:hypothetical protein